MFVYHDYIDREQKEETRKVFKEYYKMVLDPFRYCAKIELRSKTKKKIEITNAKGVLEQ